jgi:hypothetical protein
MSAYDGPFFAIWPAQPSEQLVTQQCDGFSDAVRTAASHPRGCVALSAEDDHGPLLDGMYRVIDPGLACAQESMTADPSALRQVAGNMLIAIAEHLGWCTGLPTVEEMREVGALAEATMRDAL